MVDTDEPNHGLLWIKPMARRTVLGPLQDTDRQLRFYSSSGGRNAPFVRRGLIPCTLMVLHSFLQQRRADLNKDLGCRSVHPFPYLS